MANHQVIFPKYLADTMQEYLTYFLFLILPLCFLSSCDLNSNDIPYDTDIPESEAFDAFFGAWGKEGNKIVFIHDEPLDGTADAGKLDQVWIYDTQTQERRKVIGGRAYAPNLHLNGEWVIFHTNSIPEFLYKVRIDGTDLIPLSGDSSPNNLENTSDARFSPDGNKILFTIIAGTPRGITLMDTTGTNPEIIVPFGISGDWFPDGQRIVYVNWDTTSPIGQRRQIYIANRDGSNQTKLTNLKDSDIVAAPSVSPDGTQIAFSHRGEGGRSEIFVMDVDGSNIRQLTQGEGGAYAPEWHPDGQKLLFSRRIDFSSTERTRRLWLVDIETLQVTPLFAA